MKCLLKYNFFHFFATAAAALASYLSSLHVSLYIHSLCLVYFFSSLFRPPTKIIIVIKQSFTHNLSMLNVVGLFFPSDVNYTYSISIFLLSRSSTTDNTYFHFLVQFTKAAAMENY